ncbi:uncharacterized protein LOC110637573 isoform X2 [Hevea brasiliensis]|uniref:uncharacterized protein LOC110637573 isoform X2 n=1 Tax=Hevea brasiliensis TaxID=3981 RepID=UPI0025D32931|nr:uncharacterized protein LOC110637573 isoform X2 [Hevea brasiliensis]XP_058008267.1 uncharacterized protein LOC110637573 isoform X2 [Hevea brasiliensis]
MMEYWRGVLKVPVDPTSRSYCRVGVSLCLSPSSKSLAKVAEILVSKFGGSVNAWVIEASIFNGPFAVYRDLIPSVNRWGEPKSYSPAGFPASTSTISLLSNCLKEAKKVISTKEKEPLTTRVSSSSSYEPKTYILGFSKGGTVLNQLVAELSISEVKSNSKEKHRSRESSEDDFQIIPHSKESLLNSITEIHYVDVGLNSAGAYITDHNVIERISKRLMQGAPGIRFVLHGTPRQWCDSRRVLIRNEKDKLVNLLVSEAQKSEGKLEVCEKLYFADRTPDLPMHFEIIESMEVR